MWVVAGDPPPRREARERFPRSSARAIIATMSQARFTQPASRA